MDALPDRAGPATILVVDDEKTLRDMLEYNLRREGYRVLSAAEGREAIRLAYSERPDLIILDIMLPGMSGFDVCREVRRQLTTPILMLSAREEEIDKVLGLELGADDYLTKPFGLRELLARVRAMLRRAGYQEAGPHATASHGTAPAISAPVPAPSGSEGAAMPQTGAPEGEGRGEPAVPQPAQPATLVAGDLIIDQSRRTVTVGGRVVEMRPKEFDLLVFLASHPLQVFSREALLDRVWGYDFSGGTRTVDVHVSGLRAKLEADPANPRFVQTVHTVGYKFGVPVVSGGDR